MGVNPIWETRGVDSTIGHELTRDKRDRIILPSGR
eukprot:COSAG02_NODE_64410_length_260_cov_1.273292_1_plen_34_part_01